MKHIYLSSLLLVFLLAKVQSSVTVEKVCASREYQRWFNYIKKNLVSFIIWNLGPYLEKINNKMVTA